VKSPSLNDETFMQAVLKSGEFKTNFKNSSKKSVNDAQSDQDNRQKQNEEDQSNMNKENAHDHFYSSTFDETDNEANMTSMNNTSIDNSSVFEKSILLKEKDDAADYLEDGQSSSKEKLNGQNGGQLSAAQINRVLSDKSIYYSSVR
jgi:hypothetical protein